MNTFIDVGILVVIGITLGIALYGIAHGGTFPSSGISSNHPPHASSQPPSDF